MHPVEQIELFFLFGLLALFTHWIAFRKGLFVLPSSGQLKKDVPTFSHVFIGFLTYLLALILLPGLLFSISNWLFGAQKQPHFALLVQLLSALIAACFLYFFFRAQQPQEFKKLWKNPAILPRKSILYDMGIGGVTWFVAFPLVTAINQLADALLYIFFHFESYEQVAVRYLKTAFANPVSLIIALIMILIVAPCFEEFLFRGLLQNWIKRFLGSKSAIVITSLCFALFHLAPSQSLGNISLALSLFTFALYLGFVYERQGSLFASIALHLTFNAVSTIRILFS